jgi:HAD superfamily hydrolase (TIGR01509 family)
MHDPQPTAPQPDNLSPLALLWDVDGTMIDTTALIAGSLDHIYRKFFDVQVPFDELRGLIGLPLLKQAALYGDPAEHGTDLQTVIDEFIAHYEAHKHQEVILDPVVAVLIEGKQRGFRTALVTSKNDEELSNSLPRLGIAPYVDAVVSADTASRPKPYPDGILLAMKLMKIDPAEAARCLFIGDTVHDIKAGRAAGVRTVAVAWGAGGRKRLETEKPDFICDDVEALRRCLFSASPSSSVP